MILGSNMEFQNLAEIIFFSTVNTLGSKGIVNSSKEMYNMK